MTKVTWVLEAAVFPNSHAQMQQAALSAGHDVVDWQDEWLVQESWPQLNDQLVVFHGSLGTAAEIVHRLPWKPGAFCNTRAFFCSAWYPRATQWLLHRDWLITPACELVAEPHSILQSLGQHHSVFVRPDSPLKPFSGRVIGTSEISLRALDHGFYYDDKRFPFVVAPTRNVGREWRFVVVRRSVVAGSAYKADDRSAQPDSVDGDPWRLASLIARELEPPEAVYIMDILRG